MMSSHIETAGPQRPVRRDATSQKDSAEGHVAVKTGENTIEENDTAEHKHLLSANRKQS